MKKSLSFILAFTLILTLAACTLLKDEGTYDIGGDTVTSIGGVLGEPGKRKMTNKSTATSGGVNTYEYHYATDPDDPEQAANDVGKYFQYLQDNDGFISTKAFSGLPYGGGVEIQAARQSADEGKVIILDIEYNQKGYTLIFTKGAGTLTDTNGGSGTGTTEPAAPDQALSESDRHVLELAKEALALLKNKDWGALGALVHPEQGLTFSPYGYVDVDTAVRLGKGDVIPLGMDGTVRTWGAWQSDDPIEFTIDQYYDTFIFDRDFTQAPQVSVDRVIRSEFENNLYVFGNGCVFAEFHIPGDEPHPDHTWASLRLVFGWYEGGDGNESGLYLVGIVHDQWTA